MGCVFGRGETRTFGELYRASATSAAHLAKIEAYIEERRSWTRSDTGMDFPPVNWEELIVQTPAWFCGEGLEADPRCRYCDVFASLLCDAPIGDGKTCDVPLCREHRFPIGRELDLCPIHATEWQTTTGGAGVVVMERLRLRGSDRP